EKDDDAAVSFLGLGEREPPPLERRHSKIRNDLPDFQTERCAWSGNQERRRQNRRASRLSRHGALRGKYRRVSCDGEKLSVTPNLNPFAILCRHRPKTDFVYAT